MYALTKEVSGILPIPEDSSQLLVVGSSTDNSRYYTLIC